MAIPNLAEKSDGIPLSDDDMLVLNNGQSISVREFVQRLSDSLGSPPDLPYGELDLGPIEELSPALSENTSYNNGVLSPVGSGDIYASPSIPDGIFYIEGSYPLMDRMSIAVVAPSQGFLIIALTKQELQPLSILYGDNINDYLVIGAGVFGAEIQVTFQLNNGETVGNLPSGALTSPEMTFLITATDDPTISLLTISGIAPELFSIPFQSDSFDKLSVMSIAGFGPVPSDVPAIVGTLGQFIPPAEWADGAADGKIYKVISPGTLFDKQLIIDDFVKMIDGCTDVIPWRFGNFISRLEVISIISATVDGYIVSQPVQELLATIVLTQLNALKLDSGPDSLKQFVYDNDFTQKYEQAESISDILQKFRIGKALLINQGINRFSNTFGASIELEIYDDAGVSAAFGKFARGTFKIGTAPNERQLTIIAVGCVLRWKDLVADPASGEASATFTIPSNMYTVVTFTCYPDDDTVLVGFEMYQNPVDIPPPIIV